MKNKTIRKIKSSKTPPASGLRSFGPSELTSGFTIVELIVAIGLFSIVISIAMGGLVSALRTQREIASLISADNNVSLVLEQMARELRTGYYVCHPASSGANPPCYVATGATCADPPPNPLPESTVDELDFYDAYSHAVRYRLNGTTIEKAVDLSGNGAFSFSPVTGPDVVVKYMTFTIAGNLANDCWSPRVTISIGVSTTESETSSGVLNIQTTVSTRQLDS